MAIRTFLAQSDTDIAKDLGMATKRILYKCVVNFTAEKLGNHGSASANSLRNVRSEHADFSFLA
jgi:hypothetical protein